MSAATKIQVLLLDNANDGLSVVVARCLQRAGGYRIHCISHETKHDLRFSWRSRCVHDLLDTPDHLLSAVKRYIARHRIDIVIPIQEPMISMATQMAEELNAITTLAPFPPQTLFAQADDKWLFHELMTAKGIRVPRCIHPVGNRDAWVAALASWNSAYLIKPIYGKGGNGIRKFETLETLLGGLDAESSAAPETVLVQEFIPGRDMGCSFIAHNGRIIAHTIQITTIEQCRPYTSGLAIRFVEHEGISAIARRFVDLTGWSGVANMDLRIDERNGDIHVLEVNPRYWQTLLGSLAMGINFPDLHCRLALGRPVEQQRSGIGDWINVHMISYDLINIKALKSELARAFYSISIREFFADPLLESFFILDGIRRLIRGRISIYRRRRKLRAG